MTELFLVAWETFAPPHLPRPVREYRFAAAEVGLGRGVRDRLRERGWKDWRFDYAWPDKHVAVEIEGGGWIRGRHHHPLGYEDDCYKYNVATLCGWRLLRYTTQQLEQQPEHCIAMVVALLEKDNE